MSQHSGIEIFVCYSGRTDLQSTITLISTMQVYKDLIFDIGIHIFCASETVDFSIDYLYFGHT